jgi:hypothetical protein
VIESEKINCEWNMLFILNKSIKFKEVEFTWTQQCCSSEDNYNHSQKGRVDLVKQIKAIAE